MSKYTINGGMKAVEGFIDHVLESDIAQEFVETLARDARVMSILKGIKAGNSVDVPEFAEKRKPGRPRKEETTGGKAKSSKGNGWKWGAGPNFGKLEFHVNGSVIRVMPTSEVKGLIGKGNNFSNKGNATKFSLSNGVLTMNHPKHGKVSASKF